VAAASRAAVATVASDTSTLQRAIRCALLWATLRPGVALSRSSASVKAIVTIEMQVRPANPPSIVGGDIEEKAHGFVEGYPQASSHLQQAHDQLGQAGAGLGQQGCPDRQEADRQEVSLAFSLGFFSAAPAFFGCGGPGRRILGVRLPRF
jgi:hypothetical protein